MGCTHLTWCVDDGSMLCLCNFQILQAIDHTRQMSLIPTSITNIFFNNRGRYTCKLKQAKIIIKKDFVSRQMLPIFLLNVHTVSGNPKLIDDMPQLMNDRRH